MNGCAHKSVRVQSVHKYYQAYCALLGSVEQLEHCKAEQNLTGLLAHIKQLWNCAELSDNQLLGDIAQLNQIAIEDEQAQLAGHWLPYRYNAKQQQVNWLLPVGHATEPFQDEYISRCRQQCLLNQIIQPCTSLKTVQLQAENLADVTPAGFIFHLSRCGSTLISGCLSELDSTCVLSESPLLTELLLDNNLSPAEQQRYLQAFINLQGAAFPSRPNMIIKWNAWDIFRWEFIRALYPHVPVIFLVRDPVEILASHQKMAGRHMAGDPSLAICNPVFAPRATSFLVWRSHVLAALLGEMNKFIREPRILRVDYRDLDASHIGKIGHHFDLSPNDESFKQVTQRLQFHSKTPDVAFSNDSRAKQALFTVEDKSGIQQLLMPLYTEFLQSEF